MKKKKASFGKRFARIAVFVSTALMAVLFLVALILYHNREKLLTDRAKQAAESGDYEKAVALLSSAETNTIFPRSSVYQFDTLDRI